MIRPPWGQWSVCAGTGGLFDTGLRQPRRRPRDALRGCERETEREHGSLPGRAPLHHQAAAVVLGQLAADVQAEPDTRDLDDDRVAAPIETFEDLLSLILGDADAVV